MEALRLVDILTRPVFSGCTIVAGESGIYRNVRWVHILEISNAKNLLDGGELVLTTGAGFVDVETDFLRFVEQLIEGRASALCIELGTKVVDIPSMVVDVANKHGFPIVVFPIEVRFLEITQDIHNLIFQMQHKRMIQERQVFYEQEYVERLLRGNPEMSSRTRASDRKMWSVMVLTCPQVVNQDYPLESEHRDRIRLHIDARLAFHNQNLKPYLSIREDGITAIVEHECSESVLRSRITAVMRHLGASNNALGLGLGPAPGPGHGGEVASRSKSLPVGIGRTVSDLSMIPISHKDAQTAFAVAHSIKWSGPMFYNESGIYRWVHLLLDNETAYDIAVSELNRIMKYDEECNTDLLHTLQVYLDSDRSKQLTADRLFIHRQTLYHRLETIRAILNVDLDDPIQRLSLHMSLYYSTAKKASPMA